jgi:hypothetical protein
MERTIETIPDHWMVFVGDAEGEIPEQMNAEPYPLAYTSSCVVVPTVYNEVTRIALSDESSGLGLATREPVFDRVLATPSRRLVISDAAAVILLEMSVPTDRTRIQIWTNHPSEPDEIAVVARAHE